MLGNCEKMGVIPSTSNEWPQNQIDEKGLMSSASRMMEKTCQDQQQQQQPLKCPRCDSSNTKFCYYNNYSLSQPRHFCKACKRYWTRGGTLRNVPVGGGCRKNKRVKRSGSAAEATSSSAPTATTNPSVQDQIHLSSTGSHINPLFYSLLSNPSELNLPHPRFNSRASDVDTVGYDLHQLQMNGIGLGFSSGLTASDAHSNDYRNDFNSNKQIQDMVSSSSLLSSYPIFASTSTSTSTMASLIASSLQQQKLNSGGFKDDHQVANNFQGFGPYEDVQKPRNDEGCVGVKDVKMEEGMNRLDWNIPYHNHIDQIHSSDPSLLWGSTTAGAWLDPSNIGSSVPSLI